MIWWLALCTSITLCMGRREQAISFPQRSLLQYSLQADLQQDNISLSEETVQYAGYALQEPDILQANLNAQAEEAVMKSSIPSKCVADNMQALCGKPGGKFEWDLMNMAAQSDPSKKPWFGDGEELRKKMKSMYQQRLGRYNIGWHRDEMVNKDAWEAFEYLRSVDARQVLSFRETWTDEDTRILRGLDNSSDTFTEGELTTEKMRDYLPSIKVLEELTENDHSVAVVGGGPSVHGHGKEIDQHDVVVRFNHRVGETLDAENSGLKMNIHVLNWMVDFQNETGVLHMDLESTAPALSYCKRWHKAGGSKSNGVDQVALIMRPSAFCGLRKLWGFTRGFMFYWLVGRLFDRVDLYGMSEGDRMLHYDYNGPVNEPFLNFEHLLYSAAKKLQQEQEKIDARLHTKLNVTADHLPAALLNGAANASQEKSPLSLAEDSETQSESLRPPWASSQRHGGGGFQHLNMFPWPDSDQEYGDI
mmetsp:Transcript_21582/g.50339  ORF Transcript_21582/g.50339 Transcript_21582/m.50339 type:complete len:475 (+) Transcript_21582:94-1518(+)